MYTPYASYTAQIIAQRLALFLKLLLMKFIESECCWIYSANPPIKKRLLNQIKVNGQ